MAVLLTASHRLGTVGGSPGQIPQSNAILTAVALDATGAEVSGATIGSATTDNNGETTMLPVITGNYAGDNFLHQHIRASGAAGFESIQHLLMVPLPQQSLSRLHKRFPYLYHSTPSLLVTVSTLIDATTSTVIQT